MFHWVNAYFDVGTPISCQESIRNSYRPIDFGRPSWSVHIVVVGLSTPGSTYLHIGTSMWMADNARKQHVRYSSSELVVRRENSKKTTHDNSLQRQFSGRRLMCARVVLARRRTTRDGRCHTKMSLPWKIRPGKGNQGIDMSPLYSNIAGLIKSLPHYKIVYPRKVSLGRRKTFLGAIL